MDMNREEALSDMIDALESGSGTKRGTEADPELAALLETAAELRAARAFEEPSADFADRGWEQIRQAAQQSRAPAGRFKRKKLGWIAAAASLLLVVGLSLMPLWGPSDASASQISVLAKGQIADLGVSAALFPQYAGTDRIISYGQDDQVRLWNRTSGQSSKFPLSFAYMRDASWAPDGKRIAFAGYEPASGASSPGIWVAGGDGTDPKPAAVPTDADTSYEAPIWSPAGDRIAFTATRAQLTDETGVTYDRTVVLMDADGSNLTTVAKGSQPAWSPDGKKLAYTVGEGTGAPQIWIADLQDNTQRKLTDGQMPAWSPVGSFIAYAKARTELKALAPDEQGVAAYTADIRYDELWAIHLDSGRMTQLTRSEYPERLLQDMLADTKERGDRHAEFALSGETSDWQPAWSPDGKHLVFTREFNMESANHFALQELTIAYR